MTTIQKLQIQGIRSFSPLKPNVIEFYKPLTIIVGHNGAGKTTIIECLKYACTGEFPPNTSNGQAFVFDTKIAAEAEVKAIVKLQFSTINNHPFMCLRQLSLTQNAKSVSLKTLSTTLVTKHPQTGEKHSKTMKCSDMNDEIPELMGVSKAVLENVIFCHQEESNWPLTDNSKLKKKFDDIFSATRYTKAVDAVRKQQKAEKLELDRLKLKLETLQAHYEQARKYQGEISVKTKDFEEKKLREQEYDNKITELESELAEVEVKITASKSALSTLRDLSETVKMKQKECERMRSLLPEEFSDSVSDLKRSLKDFESMMDKFDGEMAVCRVDIANLSEKLEEREKSLNSLRLEISVTQSTMDKAGSLKAEMVSTLIDLRESHYPTASPEDPTQFVKLLSEQLKECDDKISSLQESVSGVIQEMEVSLGDLLQKQAQMKSNSSQLSQELLKLRQEKDFLRNSLCKRDTLKSEATQQESKLRELESKLSNLLSTWNAGLVEKEIASYSEEISSSTFSRKELDEEYSHASAQSRDRTSFDLHKSQLAAKKAELDSEISKSLPGLEKAYGGSLTLSTMKDDFLQFQQKKEAQYSDTLTKQQQFQKKFGQYQSAQKYSATNLLQAKQQLAKETAKIEKNFPDCDDFLTLLKDFEADFEEKKKELVALQSQEILYMNFLDKGKKKSCCPLCDRKFASSAETHSFSVKMQNHIEKLPESLEALKLDVEKDETRRRELDSLRPVWDTIQRLSQQEIPKLEEASKSAEEDYTKMKDAIEKVSRISKAQKAEVENLRSLRNTVDSITRISSEYEKASKALDDLEKKMNLSAGVAYRGMEEIQSQRNSLQMKIDELVQKRALLEEESRNKSKEISHLERSKKDLEGSIVQLQSELLKMEENENTLQKCITDIEEKEKTLQQLSATINATDGKITQIREEVQEKKNECNANISVLEKTKAELKDWAARIERLQNEIQSYDLQKLQSTIERAEKGCASSEEEIAKLKEMIGSKNDVLRDIEKELSNKNSTRSAIEQNITYKELLVEYSSLKQKLAQEQKGLGDLQNSLEGLLAQRDDIASQKQEREKKKNRLLGVRIQLREGIKELKQSLADPKYLNIEQNHKKLTTQVEITEMSMFDLETYYKALDRALMKYHSAKMTEINTTIKELWQATYKGEDIDWIEIRSEMPAGISKGKRSYDYRVVMVKGDVDIDMRGRCSAGQKVLASLVIRLALAETFCVNCGIFALDEPTTNLDRRNVESFANALVEIIENRRKQRHFQLIIITHDEEFVQLLGRSNNADYYWRVTKSGGSSTLKKHEISDLS